MRWRFVVQVPTLARIDAMNDGLNARLDEVIRRLDEIDALVQSFEARVAAAAERSVVQVETHARLAQRVSEIEKLLAASSPVGDS